MEETCQLDGTVSEALATQNQHLSADDNPPTSSLRNREQKTAWVCRREAHYCVKVVKQIKKILIFCKHTFNLSKVTVQAFVMLQKISISELSNPQRIKTWTVFNIDNNQKCFLSSKSANWFLKDHVTLKTGVMISGIHYIMLETH